MAGMPNVFVIMADALRADRLHCDGNPMETSPGIDRLAREGVRFRWAMAHSANTMPCVVSAFTGLDPLVHGLNDPRTHVRHSWKGWSTPFDLLEQKGYAISGMTPGCTTTWEGIRRRRTRNRPWRSWRKTAGGLGLSGACRTIRTCHTIRLPRMTQLSCLPATG